MHLIAPLAKSIRLSVFLAMFIFAVCISAIGNDLAFAHVPVLDSDDSTPLQPFILARPYDRSIAIYTQFSSPQDIDVYEFVLDANDLKQGAIPILIGTLVPACEPLRPLLIDWLLVGPEKMAADKAADASTNRSIAIGDGSISIDADRIVRSIRNQQQGPIWHEPYSGHYYFRQQRIQLQIEQEGIYQIYVWAQRGQVGDYVFEFGDFEIWSWRDVLYTLWVLPRLWFEAEITTPKCTTNPEGK